MNVSCNLKCYAYHTQVRFGRYAVFRKECFLPLEYIYTGKNIASAKKKTFYTTVNYNNQQKHTKKKARRASLIGQSEIAGDRFRKPSTNQIAVLTRATPAIYQSFLPDGRNHPSYISHRTRTRTHKNAQHTAALETTDVRSRHRTKDQPASYRARPANTDDDLQK